MKKLNKIAVRQNLIFILSLLLLVYFWHIVTIYEWIEPLFLPSFAKMQKAYVTLFFEKSFLKDIWASVYRVFSAFTLSLFLALPLSILMTQAKWLRNLISPYIDFIRYLPVPTLIPLTILFFGIDEEAKIVLLFIGTFFQLILLIIDNLDNIPQTYYDLGFSLHFNKVKVIEIQIRSILPNLYDNSRIMLGWCWTYVVIAELVASESGIGHMIKESQRFSNTAEVFICIFVMGLIGYSTDYLFKFLYPYFFPYSQRKT